MRELRAWIVLGTVCAAITAARSGLGQGLYQPSRPTVSPWMGLFQKNPGPLDNYHSFVQPQLQLQGAMQQQNTAITQQEATLQRLGQTLVSAEHPPAAIRPTGATAAGFMNYGRYYPIGGAGGAAHRPATQAARAPARTTSGAGGGMPGTHRGF